jgi:hypothetical protein
LIKPRFSPKVSASSGGRFVSEPVSEVPIRSAALTRPPIVDVSAPLSDDPAAQRRSAREMRLICEDLGFLYIAGWRQA